MKHAAFSSTTDQGGGNIARDKDGNRWVNAWRPTKRGTIDGPGSE
jgi:hypothetical protein